MTAPEITAAIDALIADTPQPVTVWGIRYTQAVFPLPAGYIDWWCASETEARSWLAEEQDAGYSAEIVRITGRVHLADATVTDGGAR